MRIRTIPFHLIIFLLLSCSFTLPLLACECVPACTGCQTCEAGACVDDDDECDDCESCDDGTCDSDCTTGQCCENDSCVDDCPTGSCCDGSCCDSGNCCNSTTCCPNSDDVCCKDSGSYCCDYGETCCQGSCCTTGQCCDDGTCVDDCPTGECCDEGNCEPMEMDSVTSNKASACVGCDITFTATTDPTGYEDDVEWSGGGEPSTGSGATFTTYWDTSGTKTVTAELCDSSESKQVTIVKVDKVVKAGTTDEGPLYVWCPDDTVSLEAKPNPEGASFPSGEPHWSIQSQPEGASASLSSSSGSATTMLSGLTKLGEYVIKAQCGDSDMGDTIVVKIPSSGDWESWVPGFGCPCSLLFGCGDCEAEASDSPDDCGNTLTLTCNNDSGSCCFQYWYNSTEVGKCPWILGKNIFEYKITANGERFLKTEQYSCNDKRGVDSDGEGCEGYFCWRRVTFDCVDTSATPQVTWRKQDLEKCPCGPGSHPGIGEECLGEDGDHPGYPN